METSTNPTRPARRWTDLWAGLALVLVIGIYVGAIHRYSVNIPFSDDYDDILPFAQTWQNAHGITDRIHAIAAAGQMHRVGLLHLLVATQLTLTGTVNFAGLILVGNVGLLLFLWAFSRMLSPATTWHFLPAALLLLHLQYWEAALHPTLAISVFGCFLWAACAFLLLDKDSALPLAGSLLCCVLATGSFGNGLATFPLGVAALLFRKRYRHALVFAGVGVAVVAAYFACPGSPPGTYPGTRDVLMHPILVADRFFSFLGAALGHIGLPPYRTSRLAHVASLLVGVGATALVGWLTIRRYPARRPAAFLLMVFVLISAALVVRGRLWQMEPNTSRYLFVSVLFLALLITAVQEMLTAPLARWFLAASLVFSLLFCALGYRISYPTCLWHKNRLIFGLAEWSEIGTGLIYLGPADQASRVLTSSRAAGLYGPPTLDQLEGAVVVTRRDPESYHRRGILRFLAGRYPAALEDFDAALKLSPGNPAILQSRAQVLRTLGTGEPPR